MDRFSAWSGLTMNRSKTELYTACLNQTENMDMRAHRFSIGSLPVRYLGLPLMHRKLRICDYRPLLDQLRSRFTSWSSRALSFTGRRELIGSVIYGTLNFWFSSFILPKECLKQVESLCSRFLWNGNINSRAAARVSWSNCCLSKSEGGLGLRDFHTWNKTLCLKLVWFIFTENESLWVSWCKTHRFKSFSIWSLDASTQTSWIWKALLKLRNLAEQFLRCYIGNGRNTSFWYDHWTPMGPLIKIIGPSGPAQLGVPLQSTVSDACSTSGWRLRPARSQEVESLQIYLCTIPLPSLSTDPDLYAWEVDDSALQTYTAKHTWEAIRHRGTEQSWTDSVWYKGFIPSHAFMMWLAHLDRLPTRARTSAWGDQTLDKCCICNTYRETRDHLFLRCGYSEQIWLFVTKRLGYNQFLFHTWTAFMDWLELKDKVSSTTL